MRNERLGAGTFTTRMMALQFAVVGAIVLLCIGAAAWLTVERINDQAEQQALGIARAFAADHSLQAQVLAQDGKEIPSAASLASGPVQASAEAVRERTAALFVVVTNDSGLRLSHPNTAILGERVSSEPAALNGREFVAREHGTLGESVRAKVPIFASDRVIGEVSVGVAVETVAAQVRQAVVSVALIGLAGLGLAGLAAATLVRRLRRLTLGLEPEDMAQLVRDQEAVLYGVEDGVIGIGPDSRISVRNEAARLLLGLPRRSDPEDIIGRPFDEAGLPRLLVRAIDGSHGSLAGGADIPPGGVPVRLELNGRIVLAGVRRVSRAGRDLGRVVMLRDLTDIEVMGNRLEAVETMASALRAQRHEFANRLHTISGLLVNGELAHARDYVGEIIESGPLRQPVENLAAVTDTYLRAFIGAKGLQMQERGVALRVGEGTALFGTLTMAQDVTAILGNLLDNALAAAVDGGHAAGKPWVEVDLLGESDILHLAVTDSGDGIAPGLDAFAEGATTRPGTDAQEHGHGVGLSLSRRLARLGGGDVWIGDPGGGGNDTGNDTNKGAVFAARLPGVLQPSTCRLNRGMETRDD